MPAATLAQRQKNLERLCGTLSAHCPNTERLNEAKRIAAKMPLGHATAQGNMKGILELGALLSQEENNRRRGNAETILETTDDVFLYLGAFSYPKTDCGFLFVSTVENDNAGQCISTPFDSGALVSKVGVTPPARYATDGIACVRDHELPVPGYRDLLSLIIAEYAHTVGAYLHSPEEFKCPDCGLARDHPFGLSGGDGRAATFEVRIPKRVPLTSPHLHAVFVRTGFEQRELAPLRRAGVRIETFQPEPGANSSDALRAACVTFIQENFLK